MAHRCIRRPLQHGILPWLIVALSGCQSAKPAYLTQAVSTGDVREEVIASGNVSARTKVNVGSQISCTVAQVDAALGQQVRKNAVLARLDPRMLEAQLTRTRATLIKAQAERDRARLQLANADKTLQRLVKLTQDAMSAQVEQDTAALAHAGAEVALRIAEAAVQEAQADVHTATTQRSLATLVSPIDGIIIDRQIEVGQTVAAQFQVATLFTIAEDMGQVVVLAAIDEADMGRVQVGMPVQFSSDAYPGRVFTGILSVLRPAPQNFAATGPNDNSNAGVVTYLAEITADNGDHALFVGMTVQVRITTASHNNVLRVPTAALRFSPKAEGNKDNITVAHTGQQVFVVRATGDLEAREVHLGLSDGAMVEVASGLASGEEVAVAQKTTERRGRRGTS